MDARFKPTTQVLKLLVILIATGWWGAHGATALAASKKVPPLNAPAVLAGAPGGGAPNVSLSNGVVFFSNDSTHELRRVSRRGGEIITVLSDFDLTPQFAVHANGKIFGFSYYAGIVSLPENAEGVTTLSQRQEGNSFIGDIASDGNYVYWTELLRATNVTTRVLRIPVAETNASPLAPQCGCSTDRILANDLLGVGRLVLDGDVLFLSEGQTGNVYRYSLSTGAISQLASGLSSGRFNTIPLVVTSRFLYALVNGKDLLQINKLTGASTQVVHTTVPTPSRFESDAKIRSDNGAVYWWESGNGDVLKRFDETSGTVGTLAVLRSSGFVAEDIFDFYADGTSVWWANESGNNQADVQRVAVAGGAVQNLGTFANDLLPSREGLTVMINGDAENIYWKTQNGGIAGLSKQGGGGELLSRRGTGVDAVTENYFIGAADRIGKTPKRGVTEPSIKWSRPSNLFMMDLTVDDTDLYWLVSGSQSNDVHVYSMPIEGDAVRLVASFDGGRRILPYREYLVVAKTDAISVVPKSGGTEQVLFTTGDLIPSDIKILDDVLYFSVNAGGVYAVGLTTATIKPYNIGCPGWIYVDSFHVYCSTGGSMVRANLATGRVELVSDRGGARITGDERCVYWGAAYQVLSFLKTDGQCGDALPLQLASTPMLEGEQDFPYGATLHATGGEPPYFFRLLSGSLPPGLTLESDGTITGVPATVVKKLSFVVGVNDAAGSEVSTAFQARILKPLQILAGPLRPVRVGKRYTLRLRAANGKPPYLWSAAEDSLPPGLTFDSDSGVISGTPSTPGSYTFRIQLFDSLGVGREHDFVLTVQ